MCGHPLEVTLKLNVRVREISNLCRNSIFEPGLSGSVLKRRFIEATADRLEGRGTFLLPPGRAPIGRISTSVLLLLWRLLRCSLRCVTYGKQWISQCTGCLRNMCWLTFQWSQLSLRLPAEIVAPRSGRSPAGLYGGVSPSEGWWLVWVAVAHCWAFCPTLPAAYVHPLSPKVVMREVGEIFAEGERTRFSKVIPLRVVFHQGVMYNTCTGVCNKQRGGVVGCPTGGPWSSAATQIYEALFGVCANFESWNGFCRQSRVVPDCLCSIFLSVTFYPDEGEDGNILSIYGS